MPRPWADSPRPFGVGTNLWKFIHQLQKLEIQNRATLQLHEAGENLSNRTECQKRKEHKIVTILYRYNRGGYRSDLPFIRALAYLQADFINEEEDIMMLEVECMINIAVDMIIKDLRKKYFFTFINIFLRFESSSFESSLNREPPVKRHDGRQASTSIFLFYQGIGEFSRNEERPNPPLNVSRSV